MIMDSLGKDIYHEITFNVKRYKKKLDEISQISLTIRSSHLCLPSF